MSFASWATLATVIVHGGLAASIAVIRSDGPPPPPTVITIRESKRAPEPPPPPPPVAPQLAPAPAPKPAAPKRPAPAPHPAAAPASAPAPGPSAPLDFGTKLGGTGGSGPALPAPSEAPPPPPPTAKPVAKDLTRAPEPDACADPVVKPRPINVAQPVFTQDAIDAGISGKVRVEIAISKTGEITSARVIEGLGHGLDEAALAAARASTFQPATRCGQPTATTFVIGMRFAR